MTDCMNKLYRSLICRSSCVVRSRRLLPHQEPCHHKSCEELNMSTNIAYGQVKAEGRDQVEELNPCPATQYSEELVYSTAD